MRLLLLYVFSLLSLQTFCMPKPIAANSPADIPIPENMTPNSILFSQAAHNQSAQSNPASPSKNVTDTASTPTQSAKNLTAWPPVPFTVRINNHADSRIRFYKTHNTGTTAQAEQAQRLIEGEIQYLKTHKAVIGPKDLSVEADWTTLWLGCHAWVDSRSRWSNQMAIDMLKTLQEWIRENGFWETDFDVTNPNSWLANCQLLLYQPYPQRSSPIEIA